VEMVSLYTLIHPNQVTRHVMKYQVMLLINVLMQVYSLTSQPKKIVMHDVTVIDSYIGAGAMSAAVGAAEY